MPIASLNWCDRFFIMYEYNLNTSSEQFLLSIKMEKDTLTFRKNLENISLDFLIESLHSDDHKKAFWINIYNAYFQYLRKEEHFNKPQIYKDKTFTIAGNKFSLDDVEHGILRRYRYKYSLGYFPNPFAPRIIKQLAVKKLDYRIHFALKLWCKKLSAYCFL